VVDDTMLKAELAEGEEAESEENQLQYWKMVRCVKFDLMLKSTS